jgi:two-component system sensor histidine kinase PilS (NtrC family)
MTERAGDFPKTRAIIMARLLIAVVVVVLAILGGAGIERTPIIWLGVIVAVLTGVYLLWDRSGLLPEVLLHVQFACDIVLITVLAHYSGGLGSHFKILYFLPVLVASARLGAASGMVLAAASGGGHLVLTVLGPQEWMGEEASKTVADTASLLVTLGLVAIIAAYLARRARSSESALVETRGRLETSELRFSTVTESVTSGIVLVDREGRLIHVNRTGREILGLEAAAEGEEGERQDYRVVFAEVPAFCERIAKALDAGQPENRVEFFVRRKHGASVPVGLSTSILRDEAGGERGVIAIFQDLTEARRLEERLRHDDRLAALGEFAAGVAHEIRNPLNAIKGSIDLLNEISDPSNDELKLIELVQREADRLNQLLHDVLQFGRMESTDRAGVRLDSLLDEVAAIAKGHPSYDQRIEMDVETPGPVIGNVNAEQMKRALLNLTINALEAIDADGSVRLSVVGKDDFGARGLEGGPEYEVAILVEDSGCGIPSDKREEYFQPFKTTKKEGTGLGLAIVDKIVKSHDGRISLASEPGRGSRFVVYLRS